MMTGLLPAANFWQRVGRACRLARRTRRSSAFTIGWSDEIHPFWLELFSRFQGSDRNQGRTIRKLRRLPIASRGATWYSVLKARYPSPHRVMETHHVKNRTGGQALHQFVTYGPCPCTVRAKHERTYNNLQQQTIRRRRLDRSLARASAFARRALVLGDTVPNLTTSQHAGGINSACSTSGLMMYGLSSMQYILVHPRYQRNPIRDGTWDKIACLTSGGCSYAPSHQFAVPAICRVGQAIPSIPQLPMTISPSCL